LRFSLPVSYSPALAETSPRTNGCRRVTVVALLASFVCLGASSCTKTEIGLSIAGIGAAVVLTTVVVTHEVGNQRHTLKGCLISGPNGLELRTSDSKAYALEGELASIKVGDRVRLHGSKLKQKDAAKDQVFVVDKLGKNYGSCS
jgi:hypothetical protein